MFSQTMLQTNLGITNTSQQAYLYLVANFLNQYLETRGLVFYSNLPAQSTKIIEARQSQRYIKTPYFQALNRLTIVDLIDLANPRTILETQDYLLYQLASAPNINQEKPVYQIQLLRHILHPQQGLEITAKFGFSDTLPTGIELAGSALAFKMLNQHLERKGANTWDGRVLLTEQLITTSTDTNRTWASTAGFTNRLALQAMVDDDQDFQSAVRKWALT